MPFPRRAVRRAALGDAGAVRRAAPGNDAATPRRAARRGALAGAAAIALTLLAAACGSSASSTAGSSSSVAAGANGTLNWEWELPTSWDPVTSSAGLGRARPRPGLRLDHHARPGRNAGPGLATSWKYAADGKSVTFTLRPGLKFSDGTPLNAQAVQGEHRARPEPVNSNIASELAVISKVVVNSPTSFTLDLTQVDYQLPDLLAGKDGMMVSPAAFTTNAGQPAHPPGRRGAVQADQLRPGLARRPGPQPRLLGRQPDPPGQLHRAVHHPAGADPGRPGVRPGQRGLHRRQPGRGGQGRRVQDRRDPVRGGERARHPDHHGAVQQPERGQGHQLRDQPPGDRPGPGVGLRGGRPTSRSRRASSGYNPSWPTCTPTTRPRRSSCWPRPATRTA